MNIINTVIKSAASGFGREFGRAGANAVLKNANSYSVNISNYSGRIKQSDSEIVKTIKELNKLTFTTTNKTNVSKLISITDLIISNLKFESSKNIKEIEDMLALYSTKYAHGCAMIDDDFVGESVEYLESRRKTFYDSVILFKQEFVNHNVNLCEKNKTSKYQMIWKNLLLGILTCWLIVPIFIVAYRIYKITKINQNDFDAKYNKEYAYYKHLKDKLN